MKNNIKNGIFLLIPLLSLTSCKSSLTKHVEEFGDASFYDTYNSDVLVIQNHYYYWAGSLEENSVETINNIAAFNFYESSVMVYSTNIENYPGILIVEYASVMSSSYSVYVDEDEEYVPVSILYDFPHNDDWFNNGQNFELNNVTYSSYGTSKKISEKGNYVGKGSDDKDYYDLLGYDNWVCTNNKYSDDSIDISYSLSITELPVELIKQTHEIDNN